MPSRPAAPRAALVAAALGAVAIAAPATARADALVPGATCAADAALSQPFAQWGDTNEYRLLPGSDFTDGAPGWTLRGGATVTAGGDPFDLTGTPSADSVALPAGSTVISPFSCIDVTQPTFRFLDDAASSSASVAVSVVYTSAQGTATIPVGLLSGSTGWQPSPTFENGAAIAGLLQGGTAQMAIRLDGVSGTTQVDDVFVDPQHGWG